jgi:hypothetical protein
MLSLFACCGIGIFIRSKGRLEPQVVNAPAAPPVMRPSMPSAQPTLPVLDAADAASAKRLAEQKRREEEALKEKEKLARAKEEAERVEQEMIRYELAKAEYHATAKLASTRNLLDAAQKEKKKGNDRESQRLLGKAEDRLGEVVALYPDTEAAADARQILNGKNVPERPIPPPPNLPQLVTANDDDVLETLKRPSDASSSKPSAAGTPSSTSAKTPGSPGPHAVSSSSKDVYVRGYTRKDGTYVAPHTRAAPGMGTGKR